MPMTPAQRKQFICDCVNEKARASAEGQANWGESIVGEMKSSVPFELTAEEEKYVQEYTAWRKAHPF
ncbi:MAG TPA: hypothetical protein VN777_16070 [Terriglobales bacterium]|nr:hypothetical protein [Terriglobales bacterium]HZW96736.1 hypothetical protein [Candidatus Eremiobacteraceae bacterium]